ncbi:MAG: AsmA-like C-terminal domain-containing protein [Nitrospiria bacterium]
MKNNKNLFWRIFRGLGIFILFLILLAIITFFMINSKPIQEKIMTLVSPRSGEFVKFQKIRVALFPRPSVTIFNTIVTIPATVSGQVASIRIYPSLLPLLNGKIIISKVKIDAAKFIVELTEKEPLNKPGTSSNMLAEINGILAPPVAFVQSIAPDLILQVNHGSLLLRNNQREFTEVHNIFGKFDLIPDGINFSVKGDTNLWGPLSVKARIVVKENVVSFKELTVSAGRSSLSSLTGQFEWERTPILEIISGRGEFDLEDLFGKRFFMEIIQIYLKEVKKMKGSLALSEIKFTGPLLHAEKWEMKIAGKMENILFESARLPGPLMISHGQFMATMNSASLSHIQASIIQSSISDLSARLAWKAAPSFEILSGRADLNLDNLSNYLKTIPSLRDLLRNVRLLTGKIRLTEMQFSGLVQSPESWRFASAGGFEKVLLDSSDLTGHIQIDSGQFRATNKVITLNNVRTNMPGSSLTGSGQITGSYNRIQSVTMSFRGTIGAETAQWFSNSAQISPIWAFQAPITFSDATVSWQEDGTFSSEGNGTLSEGLSFSFDLRQDQNEFMIKRFSIEDDQSRASLSLREAQRELDLSYSGTLTHKSLMKIFRKDFLSFGSISGNLRGHFPLDHLLEFTATGNMAGNNLTIPAGHDVVLNVPELSIKGDRRTFSITKAVISWGEMTIDLKGGVKSLKDHFLIDLDASSDRIKIEPKQEGAGKVKKRTVAEEIEVLGESLKSFPVQGTVRFVSPSVTYGKITIESLESNLTFSQDGFRITLLKARYCNISIPGNLARNKKGIELNFKLEATDQSLEQALSCMSAADIRMKGTFDLNGELHSDAKNESLFNSLQGKVKLVARNGRIDQYLLVARILAVLNLTEILEGKIPDLQTKGLDYESITIMGELQNGKMSIVEATLNGPTLNMAGQGEVDFSEGTLNLTILVAPFKTINDVINFIPLVRTLLGRTLISIPVQVTGQIGAPSVIPLAPQAIGSKVLGIMKRVLKFPFKVIGGIIPEKKESSPAN